jgi:hypothetical protein
MRTEPVYDIDQLRRNVQVMDLLTRSYEAHSRGDRGAFESAFNEAVEIDAAAVSVLRGGMMIGEVPSPERDWETWIEYVQAARDKLAAAEGED